VLLEAIGEGAQGRTFDAVDKRPPRGAERAVAIKRFDVRGATSWKDVELAEREVAGGDEARGEDEEAEGASRDATRPAPR
jgi:hypothetical protein